MSYQGYTNLFFRLFNYHSIYYQKTYTVKPTSLRLLNWLHLNIQFVILTRFNSCVIQFTALQQKRYKLAHVFILPEDNLKLKKTVVPKAPTLNNTDDVLVVLGNIGHRSFLYSH